MKTFVYILILALIGATNLTAQVKGVSPVSGPTEGDSEGSTYALVIGISDYQDTDIPDLSYAHRDAQAFAEYLRSPAGGELDEDHLRVLLNEQATSGQVISALYWLLDESRENDRVILYFSGHGDVENKLRGEPGYLLCWDAPARVYPIGGTIGLGLLQNVISTLSIDLKARVTVITDACRAGKLAGSSIGGAQATSANLRQQYANEIKILSCQPNEYSIEGEDWGGGRGAFSYHLIDGLYGMADRNDDRSVTLMEVSRYLEDHVTEEVAPHSQIPMTIGSRTEEITTVIPELLEKIKAEKKGQVAGLSATAMRGLEDEVLAKADEETRRLYRQFQQALEEKNLMGSTEACAEAYYRQLAQNPVLEPLHNNMRRNYAATLQDDAQWILNLWLKGDMNLIPFTKKVQEDKFQVYPNYLARAAELLGEDHYMYTILQARKAYFEGYLMHIDHRVKDRQLGERILAKYRESLKWQPESPHVYYQMTAVHFFQMAQPDSAEHYAHLATKLAPAWTIPYSYLGWMYTEYTASHDLEKARYFLELADQVDTSCTSEFNLFNWAHYYAHADELGKAEEQWKAIIALDSISHWAYANLGNVYLIQGKFEEAIQAYRKSIALDATNRISQNNLGLSYYENGQYEEAARHFRAAIELDSSFLWPRVGLAKVHVAEGRLDEAEKEFREVIAVDSSAYWAYEHLGLSYGQAGHYQRAIDYFQKSLDFNPDDLWTATYLAWWQYEADELSIAERGFKMVMKRDILQKQMEAWYGLGFVYVSQERFEEAEAVLQEVTALASHQPESGHLLRSVLHTARQQWPEAAEQLEKALAQGLNPEHNRWFNLYTAEELAPLREQKKEWRRLMKNLR